jgi:hypothetical protein
MQLGHTLALFATSSNTLEILKVICGTNNTYVSENGSTSLEKLFTQIILHIIIERTGSSFEWI